VCDEGRFGARLGKPSDTLADQLDLPRDHGLVVEEVSANSTAGRAGIKRHDILLELDGQAVVSDLAKFAKRVAAIKPKMPIKAVVLRKGKKVTINKLTLPKAAPANVPAAGPGRFGPMGGVMPALPPAPAPGMGPPAGAMLPQLPGTPMAPGLQLGVVRPAGNLPQPPAGPMGPAGALAAPQMGMAGPAQSMTSNPPRFDNVTPGATARNPKGTVTVIVRDQDQFTTRRQHGTTVISVTGTITAGKAKVKTIEVRDATSFTQCQTLDRVPKTFLGRVKELIALTEKDLEKAEKIKP
jgi:hypothetical protein